MKCILIFIFEDLFVLSISALVVAAENKVIGDPSSIYTRYSMPANLNLEPEGMQLSTLFVPALPSEGDTVFIK